MGSVTFRGPLDTSFLFAQIVGKQVCLGPQNLALCKVLGSKCDKNKCGKYSGKFVKLVFARYLPFVAETSVVFFSKPLHAWNYYFRII